MSGSISIRSALITDVSSVNLLLSEWFDWKPKSGRLTSVRNAIGNRELHVAERGGKIVGFIHCILHEDIIDGAPNSFISAFYVTPAYRRQGVGTRLVETAVKDSLERGAVGVETSTTNSHAKRLYEKQHFKQTIGDIAEVFLELDITEYLGARNHAEVEPTVKHRQTLTRKTQSSA